MLNKVSYIIGHRDNNPDKVRTNNLIAVVEHIKAEYPMVEILIVEQSENPSESILSIPDIKYVHCFNKDFYNRSWGFNIGFKNTNKEYIVCADNDIIIKKEQFVSAVDKLTKYDAVNPFTKLIDLSQINTNIYLKDKTIRLDNNTVRKGTVFCSGVCMYTRCGFEECMWWDEDFKGWGAEDDAQTYKVKKLLSHTTISSIVYHLFHSRSVLDGTERMHAHYKENVRLMNYIKSLDNNKLKQYYTDKILGYGNIVV
jgi:hypothetical protein